MADRAAKDRAYGGHDVFAGAAGKAVDQDGGSPLLYAEAWGAIGVRWTAAHGVVALPVAAQAFDDIERLLGGFVVQCWLLGSTACPPLPSRSLDMVRRW